MKRIATAVLVVATTFAACSTESPRPSGATPNDSGVEPALDSGSDASTSPRYQSFFMVERWRRTSPHADFSMTGIATFHEGADAPKPHFVRVDDNCAYHEGLWAETGARAPSFGTVTMTTSKMGEVTWTEDAEGGGYQTPTGTIGWEAGDAVTVTAAGREAPGFELQDIVPAPATLTSIDLANVTAGQVIIPRDAPFALTWTPVASDVFALFLQLDTGGANRPVGLLCFFPGATGAASIPVAALAHLRAGADAGIAFTNFYFSGASRKHVALEGFDVDMVTWNGTSARVVIQ